MVLTDVTLYQYDKSSLMIKGQCKVTVKVLGQKICATLMVDVKTQIPIFGRDWMVSFWSNLPIIRDYLSENPPSSHLPVFQEIPF